MTVLQEQAVQMVLNLSDEARIRKVIRFIEKIEPSSHLKKEADADKISAFNRLNSVWDKVKKYYPNGFDADAEYSRAMDERYGYIG